MFPANRHKYERGQYEAWIRGKTKGMQVNATSRVLWYAVAAERRDRGRRPERAEECFVNVGAALLTFLRVMTLTLRLPLSIIKHKLGSPPHTIPKNHRLRSPSPTSWFRGNTLKHSANITPSLIPSRNGRRYQSSQCEDSLEPHHRLPMLNSYVPLWSGSPRSVSYTHLTLPTKRIV